MIASQAQPIAPQFHSTQGQIDALLASLVAIVNVVPAELRPALRAALANAQIQYRETAFHRSAFSDEYFAGYDQIAGGVWRLGLREAAPNPFE